MAKICIIFETVGDGYDPATTDPHDIAESMCEDFNQYNKSQGVPENNVAFVSAEWVD